MYKNKYFIWNPTEEEFWYFDTEAKRLKAITELLEEYRRDDEWPLEIEDVVCGIITHISQRTKIEKPQVDNNGFDKDGKYWAKKMEYCDYKMKRVEDT